MNRDRLLSLIRLHQPVARGVLAQLSGLQNSTVSSIAEQLAAEGWVAEGAAIETSRGRRPTLLSLHPNPAILVAEVRLDGAEIGIADLNGELAARTQLKLPTDPEQAIQALGRALQRLQSRHADRRFAGAGICIPGRIDPLTRSVVLSPGIRWEGTQPEQKLAAMLGLPVEVENEASASMLAETWFGEMRGTHDAVLLSVSAGIGAAMLAGGQLVRGRQGLAGELGHIQYEPAGPMCDCGRRGCWEAVASSRATLHEYARLSRKPLTYPELCAHALAGEAHALAALQRQAMLLGRGMRFITASVAPQYILLAGDILHAWPIAEPILLEHTRRNVLGGEPPVIARSRLGDSIRLRGLAAAVLERHGGFYHAATRHSV